MSAIQAKPYGKQEEIHIPAEFICLAFQIRKRCLKYTLYFFASDLYVINNTFTFQFFFFNASTCPSICAHFSRLLQGKFVDLFVSFIKSTVWLTVFMFIVSH